MADDLCSRECAVRSIDGLRNGNIRVTVREKIEPKELETMRAAAQAARTASGATGPGMGGGNDITGVQVYTFECAPPATPLTPDEPLVILVQRGALAEATVSPLEP